MVFGSQYQSEDLDLARIPVGCERAQRTDRAAGKAGESRWEKSLEVGGKDRRL